MAQSNLKKDLLLLQNKKKKRKKKVIIYCGDKWKKFSVHQADAFVLCNEGKNGSALPFFLTLTYFIWDIYSKKTEKYSRCKVLQIF